LAAWRRARLASGFERLGAQITSAPIAQLHQNWEGDRLNFQARALGQIISGAVDVGDTELRMELALPSLLAGFAEKIAGKLRNEGRILLEKK
jgi:Putative polyhydroxyalkanoic acid system protein (PHA_gran_rgn)